jgi:hypothetical protein
MIVTNCVAVVDLSDQGKFSATFEPDSNELK